ncbi:hypothetical protein [Pseudosporangium ferrugineum]|uniref:Uncharacterized protein n=1 Tax=Pseudosporangium ferrugineum TaxID=439699 RepID=A0A2T0RSA8_9ACTN|nr:hypothetical protein [Pseudosporangium ferrugineum]PRY24041.1 hypothetical protein CLV70_114174 [Pseudosporangium ferrugineum]
MNGTDADLTALLGPNYAERLTRGLSPEQQANVNEYVSQHGGSHAAALNVQSPELAAQIDALFNLAGAR